MRLIANTLRASLSLARRRGHVWLPHYLRQQSRYRRTQPGPDRHLIFTFVDHFEPSRAAGERGVEMVRDWCRRNVEISKPVVDDDGLHPQHTWFYRYDYPNFDCLRELSRSVYDGFGEIEFHLHHGHDTSETFREKIEAGKKWFGTAGAMRAVGTGQAHFAYIAGNWALANGQEDASKSGVDEEIVLLRDAGCYADFTFPAFGERSQTRQVNDLYYAVHSDRVRCYETGPQVAVGQPQRGDLMIFQGPLYIAFGRGHVDYAAVEDYAPYFEGRCKSWIKAGVSVEGMPDWVFVKVHTHGMQSAATVVGNSAALMYKDVVRIAHERGFKVHFTNAREAYNIAKAAEAGLKGNPAQYRDYLVPKPVNRVVYCNQPSSASVTDGRIEIAILDQPGLERSGSPVQIELAESPIQSLSGEGIRAVRIAWRGNELERLEIDGDGPADIRPRTGHLAPAVPPRAARLPLACSAL